MAPPKRCLEFIVQIAAMFASGGAMTAAVLTEIKYKNLEQVYIININAITGLLKINELYLKTEAMAGLVFATTGVAVVAGIIALIGRIINAKNDESNQRLFSCLYLVYIQVCFLGFAAAGILGAFVAKDWFDVHDSPILITGRGDIEDLRNSVTATSVCSLVAALLYGVLEIVLLFCCSANRYY